jgi:hypothetical protein
MEKVGRWSGFIRADKSETPGEALQLKALEHFLTSMMRLEPTWALLSCSARLGDVCMLCLSSRSSAIAVYTW